MDRPAIVIISDEAEFPRAVTEAWRSERDSPVFTFQESSVCGQLQNEGFDLAIVGSVRENLLDLLLSAVLAAGKPVIHVSRLNRGSPRKPGIITLPGSRGWAEILPVVAGLALECRRSRAALDDAEKRRAQFEQQATLGCYMLDVRHNLNNALTSVLGNSDLLLMEGESLAPNLRAQVETIRNMGMRMNEIMQRFSSLQKEMQLVEQQVRTMTRV